MLYVLHDVEFSFWLIINHASKLNCIRKIVLTPIDDLRIIEMHNYCGNISIQITWVQIPEGIYHNVLDNTYLQNNSGSKI
jgi:hypothetical protein